MKEETKKRKAKQEKLKKELKELKSNSTSKMSKHDENQFLLKSLSEKKKERTEDISEDNRVFESRRSFTCVCGCIVNLEGDPTVKKNKEGKELCSRCS